MNNEISNEHKPAFAAVCEGYGQDGLTKREYFAAMAMQGLCAFVGTNMDNMGMANLATESIQIADELLRQLEI